MTYKRDELVKLKEWNDATPVSNKWKFGGYRYSEGEECFLLHAEFWGLTHDCTTDDIEKLSESLKKVVDK